MSEQFENSIRKKLQEAEAPFDPAAWDQMKKRLDDSGRRRPAVWWWAGGLLLFLGVGSWWWFSQHQPVDNVVNNRITATDSSAGFKTNPPGADSHADNEKNTQVVDNGAPVNNAAAVGRPVPGNAAPKVPAAGNNINATTGSNSVRTPAIDPAAVNKPAQGSVTTNANNATADKPDAGNVRTNVNNTTPDKPVANNVPTNPVVDKPANNNNNTKTPTTDTDSVKAPNPAAIATVDKPEQKKIRKRGFDGGLTMGPDYNSVPSLKHGRIGFGGGLLVRYHINNNFYLSTGAVYTKKIYGAEDKDYTSAYPTNYKKIEADCNVLDVPLNIHYTFLHRPKSSWSVMAGASSYFMLNEKYDYYNYNDVKYTREFRNNNQHYFSVLNLGVSWERETRGKINWGIQPYVKLPLGGVGEGNIKLYSAGVSLQVTIGKKD